MNEFSRKSCTAEEWAQLPFVLKYGNVIYFVGIILPFLLALLFMAAVTLIPELRVKS